MFDFPEKMDVFNHEASNSNEVEAQKPIDDPKFLKTQLCAYYLRGPCKNGDSCTYAHGTSQLRTPSGCSMSQLEDKSLEQKKGVYKTSLCVKFVTNGFCPYGVKCHFAHGVKELRASMESVATEESADDKSPYYKTSMCKNYIVGMFCTFADKCQYAHGKHELRDKPKSKSVSELTDDERRKLVEKARALPGYKTKLCANYTKDCYCTYEDVCMYAHGKGELREETPAEKAMAEEMKVKKNPFYKTAMCKNASSCTFGDSCFYAHASTELRLLEQNLQAANHGKSPVNPNGYPPRMAAPGSAMGGVGSAHAPTNPFKTVLCKNYNEKGQCQFGQSCNFAHGQADLRTSGPTAMPHMTGAPKPFGWNYGQPQAGPSGMAESLAITTKDGKIKYKTAMCSVYLEHGHCPRGNACNYAHSAEQLLAAQAADPKYKTILCDSWTKAGTCQRGSNCIYAHGEKEKRQYNVAAQAGPYMPYGQPYAAPAANYPAYPGYGGAAAAAQNDLHKTAMCKSIVGTGNCSYGARCNFAHSQTELRAKKPAAFARAPGFESAVDASKRKREPTKSVLCQFFNSFGNCQYGETCSFAHGHEELSMNKRLRM